MEFHKIKKNTGLLLSLFMVLTGISAFSAPIRVDDAIQLAYNLKFDQAEEVLAEYRSENPADVWGDLGQVVYDFLKVKQDPGDENFNRIFSDLKTAEDKVDETDNSGGVDGTFAACFLCYYRMKSYALSERWIHTAASAVEARKLSVELLERGNFPPEMYFILGEQDYTTSLAPDYLKPLLKGLNFSPDQAEGLAGIARAAKEGGLTRYEANLMYISSCIYIEKDYDSAIRTAESFLGEFPGNLSVRFFYIDLLLRTGRLSEAEKLLSFYETAPGSGELAGKWLPRYIQMTGNLCNALGDYNSAVELYRESLSFDEISGYTASEINLEMGKLLDITGRRQEAIAAYKACYQGDGFTLHKDEAKELKKDAYSADRGSY